MIKLVPWRLASREQGRKWGRFSPGGNHWEPARNQLQESLDMALTGILPYSSTIFYAYRSLGDLDPNDR
jgi:hypothetical protein